MDKWTDWIDRWGIREAQFEKEKRRNGGKKAGGVASDKVMLKATAVEFVPGNTKHKSI